MCVWTTELSVVCSMGVPTHCKRFALCWVATVPTPPILPCCSFFIKANSFGHNSLPVCNQLPCLFTYVIFSIFCVLWGCLRKASMCVLWLLEYALLVMWITRSCRYLWTSIWPLCIFCVPIVLSHWHILIQILAQSCLQSLTHIPPSEYYFISLFAQKQEFLSLVSHQSWI